MDFSKFYPARSRSGVIGLDVTSTASGFAAVSGSKWVAQSVNFAWCGAVSSATMGFFETTSSGSFSETGVFFQSFISTTAGIIHCNFGDIGCMASSSNSRMGVFVGSCTLSWTLLTSGYYQS